MIEFTFPALLASTGPASVGLVAGAALGVPTSLLVAHRLGLPGLLARVQTLRGTRTLAGVGMALLALAACVMLGWIENPWSSLLVAGLFGGLMLKAIAPVGPIRKAEPAVVVKGVRTPGTSPTSQKPAPKPEPRKAA